MAVLSFTALSDAIIARTAGFRTDYRDTIAASNFDEKQLRILDNLMNEASAEAGVDLALEGDLTVGGGITVDGASTVDADLAVTGELSVTQLISPAGGITAAGGFTAYPFTCHTGGNPASLSTDGTNLSAVVTELYVAAVFIPCNATVTGASVFWGDATEGNAKVMLFSVVDTTGTRRAISASTDISGFTADSYGTRIPFATPYAAKGPATYYVGVICDSSSNRVNTHVLGNFGAGKITGLVYATEAGYASITVPDTFTTGLGPIATLY